jgi:site-specific DNA-methyltransferase (adenine-specific)
MTYKIINKNNIEYLKTQPDDSFDSIVTDPPYGIEFLDKDWDKNTGAVETWKECLRVLKPGGHLLAFSAARTYHHLATNIEQVGFEIRDQLMWLYSSGFPKAQKIKDCEGWKTSLKPAHEPIVMARKPYKGSTYKNMDQYGVGALNIDESRVPYENQKDFNIYVNNIKGPLERSTAKEGDNIGMHEGKTGFKRQKGKVVLPSGGANGLSRLTFGEGETTNADSFKQYTPNQQGRYPSNVIGEVEGYQKYFYCPKVTRKERMPFNNHPTVKPVELMKYLIKLVTPPNSRVLDPFCGSGSTGMAAVELGHEFIGCELDANYVDICIRRIEGWNKKDIEFERLFDAVK